jgi:organic radical activating enzyme
MQNVKISEQSCGCGDFKELRVAFGDLNNCQLKCPFCFTLEQSEAKQTPADIQGHNLDRVRIVRFTGGEPLLYQHQICAIAQAMAAVVSSKPKAPPLFIVQTNAVLSPAVDITPLLQTTLPLLFEVSLKGTNEREYQYLTYQEALAPEAAQALMRKQLNGYAKISELCHSPANIRVLARLGVFHSSRTSPTFAFVFPGTNELMFHPGSWSQGFKDVLADQKTIWGQAFDGKVVVEKLKTPGDGSPRMGPRYRAIIDHLKALQLLQESKRKLAPEFAANYFYKKGNDVYWKCAAGFKEAH